MIKTYIDPRLIRELQENFPNKLPDEVDYFSIDRRGITPEQIAFNAGIQHLIRYMVISSKQQNDRDSDEEIQIL